jgi:surface carbohydrate biosynthesis protein
MEPIAYLTVEVKHRDLDPRLLIASHLVEAGVSVMVGQQWMLFDNADALPQGIVLFKTVNEIQAKNMAFFSKAGHLVAATDEEVLQCIDDRCFTLAFSPIAANNCDLFLAQSPVHKDAIDRLYPEMEGKVEIAGNSRIDLLSPRGRPAFAAEAESLKRDYGPYVLFNTNFGSINSIWKDLSAVVNIAVSAGAVDLKNEESKAEFKALIGWERKNFDELVPLMHWVVDNVTSHRIVIRPHPGERANFWENEFGNHPRVTVIPRSNPHPWIMGADLVIHTGCTTGLEAVLMDKPTINLKPAEHPSFDRIVNWANPTFTTWQDAAAAIAAFMETGTGPVSENAEKYAAVLEQYIPGYHTGDAARSIASCLMAKLKARGAQPSMDYRMRFRGEFRVRERGVVARDKFLITRAEFMEHLREARTLTGYTSMPTVETIHESLFLLSPAAAVSPT